jgi:hypothetical protein
MAIKMTIDGEEVEATTEEDLLMLFRVKRRLQAEQKAQGVTNAPTGMAAMGGMRSVPRAAVMPGDGVSSWQH